MNHLTYSLELKTLDAVGKIAGYASVFNVIDQHQDIIKPGAFKGANMEQVKLLWQHNAAEPIGVITKLCEDEHGLYFAADLLLSVRQAREAYALLKSKAISGVSIGYVPAKYHFDKNNIRIIEQVDLWEISLVTFPANQHAEITCVKSNSFDALYKALERACSYLS